MIRLGFHGEHSKSFNNTRFKSKLDVCVDMCNLLGDPLHLEPAVCGVDGSHDVEMPAFQRRHLHIMTYMDRAMVTASDNDDAAERNRVVIKTTVQQRNQ